MAVLRGKVGVLMVPIAGALTLYLVDPYAAMIYILLTGYAMYDPADTVGVILALLVLGGIRRAFFHNR